MKNPKKLVRIESFKGTYDNDDAYESVLGYLYRKHQVTSFPTPNQSLAEAVTAFRMSKELSHYQDDRNIWHVIITFSKEFPKKNLLLWGNTLANHISSKYYYQTVVAIDTGRYGEQKSHLHFAINHYNCIPNQPVMSNQLMCGILETMASYMHYCLPDYHTSIQYNGINKSTV